MRAPSLPTKWGNTLPRGKLDSRSIDSPQKENTCPQIAPCSIPKQSSMASDICTESAQELLVPKEEPDDEEIPELLAESAFVAEAQAACPVDGGNGSGPFPSAYGEPQMDISEPQPHVLQFPILMSAWTAEESKLLDDGRTK